MFLVAVFAAFSLAPGWRALGGGVPIAAVLVAALLLACILLGRRLKHSLALNNDLAAQAADLAQSNTLFKVELDEHRQVETALRRQKNHLEIQLKAGTCELQRAEADQRQTADILNEYQMALEASDDMVAVLDRTYTYRMANKAFLEQRRTDRAAVIGRTVADVMGDDAFHALRPHLDACFQGDSVEYEMVPENAGLGNRHFPAPFRIQRNRPGSRRRDAAAGRERHHRP